MERTSIGRAAWIVTGALLVALTIAFALGQDGWKRTVTEPGADAPYYYAYLPSIVLDGDLDFANQYQVTKNWYKLGKAPTGKPSNVFGIGPAVYEAPAFLVGHGLALVTGSRSDGFSRWETVLCMWVSIPFTLGALLLAFRLARRRLGPGLHAYLGPLLALVSGPVLYYAIRQPGYAHPFATFFATLLIERWDASYDGPRPRSLRTWLVLGAAAGGAVLARPQLVTWALLLLPMAIIDDIRKRGAVPLPAQVRRWAAAALVAFVIVLPQLVAWKSVYGAWYTVPQGDGFMRWDSPAWSETLFSSRNGLLPWAPLYAPMLVCTGLLVRRMPRLVAALVLGLVGQAIVNGAAWDWWAGGSFGGRRFDSTYVVFALGAAAGLRWAIGAVRQFHAGARSWKINARFGAATVALAVTGLVAVATIELTFKTSITSARIKGGQAATASWRQLGGLRGNLAAMLSGAANAPVRLAYAVRYDVGLYDYDRIVGVHYLGDTYAGLNSYADKTVDTIEVGKPDVRHSGLEIVDAGRARIPSGSARLLVGLNRRGGVTLRVPVEVTAPGKLTIRWNDEPYAFDLVAGPSTVTVVSSTTRRGTNVVELQAPRGATLGKIELRASP